ncbi:chemotaxis protein MotB [Thiosulfatimonas sediminis]|uniref:Chemotaxis protein MotB n=1 Tax=Thiosulfatimonas sediminis TaxID=2675054 RepID=A0A6F8PS79_9GAMM|nr:OmpA family protein [Thiosulfatimonas sediminis]BBP44983.1 chemotaxis protein MotB [Thiosulfatimonas sediminis]
MLSLSKYSKGGSLLFKGNPVAAAPTWLLVYIGLFTSLLAIFLFILSVIELESVPPKRAYQNVVNDLYQRAENYKQERGMVWLQVENTLNKGVRLSLDPNILGAQNLFESAQVAINPELTPYLLQMAKLIESLNLPQAPEYYQRWLRHLQAVDIEAQFFVRVEGHTDAYPMLPNARFKDNVELSSYRAYAVMSFLQLYSGLAPEYFMIAGYGSFHPLRQYLFAAHNRRVEVYLLPKLSLLENSSLPLPNLRQDTPVTEVLE